MFCLMAERGLTAKKIADATGISTGNISDWKSGRSSPSVLKLEQIADFLDCSIDFLVGRTNQPGTISEIRGEDQELIAAVHRLDARDQGKVLGYVAKGSIRQPRFMSSRVMGFPSASVISALSI